MSITRFFLLLFVFYFTWSGKTIAFESSIDEKSLDSDQQSAVTINLESKIVNDKEKTQGGNSEIISSGLLKKIAAWEANPNNAMIEIDINCDDVDKASTVITDLGGEIVHASTRYNQIRAIIPVGNIRILAASNTVSRIKEGDQAYTR